jgi:hypothetical protein
MKGCINTWKCFVQYGDEINMGLGGHIMMNVTCTHAVSICVK